MMRAFRKRSGHIAEEVITGIRKDYERPTGDNPAAKIAMKAGTFDLTLLLLSVLDELKILNRKINGIKL